MLKRSNTTSALAERRQGARLGHIYRLFFSPLIRLFPVFACSLPCSFDLILDELLSSAFPNAGVSPRSINGAILFDDGEGTDCEIQLQSNSVAHPRAHKSSHT